MMFPIIIENKISLEGYYIGLICNGEFNAIPDFKIGELFESFFDNINYNVVKEENATFVDFTGDATCDDEPCTILIRFKVNEEVSTITISNTHLQSLYAAAKEDDANRMSEADYEKFIKITDFIYDQFDLTFGNRILTQIDNLVPIFVACGGKKEDALDFLLSRKVIYKLEGRFEEYVKGALKELLVLIEKTYGASVLKRSEKTIQTLMRRL